jgi:hypothetical protein
MIARIWRGATREADRDTYFEYLQKTGLKEYKSIPGNRGVWVLRRQIRVHPNLALGFLGCHQSLRRPGSGESRVLPRRRQILAGKRPGRYSLRSPVMPVSMSAIGILQQRMPD